MANTNKKPTPVVSVLNMKGGVGKTTVTAHIFREAYRLSMRRTLLIDLDPQFNLTQTILTRTQYEDLRKSNKTIIGVFEDQSPVSIYNICLSNNPPPKPDHLSVRQKTAKAGSSTVYLDLIPGDFRLNKFALSNNENLLNVARQRFLEFIEQCKSSYDLVCIDCNPSSSFITLCALRACSHILVPVKPDRYSILGLELLDDFVNGIADLPVKPKKIILLNGVSTNAPPPPVEKELRGHAQFGPLTLANRLMQSKLLEAKHDSVGFATDRNVSNIKLVTARIRAIAAEIETHL